MRGSGAKETGQGVNACSPQKKKTESPMSETMRTTISSIA
jgi:hypothetical protein